MAKTPVSPNRKQYSQLIDYRIFVVSAYHNNEITPTTELAAFGPPIAGKRERFIDKHVAGSYTFYKYAIDNYVTDFSIRRSIDGEPASLDLSIFPVKDSDFDSDFNLYYQKGLQSYPIFRRMDYIEIQVSELTYAEDEAGKQKANILSMNKLLANKNRSTNYEDATIAGNYNVRFRGFITGVTDSDSAEGGRSIRLQAKSMLHYIASSPFISNFALVNDKASETERAFLPSDNYVTLMGDLLTDLRDASTRVHDYLLKVFQATHNYITTDGKPYVSVTRTQSINPFRADQLATSEEPIIPDGYFVGEVSSDTTSELGKLTTSLAETTPKGTQALLIPLLEVMLAYKKNIVANRILYRVRHLTNFNKEIVFGGKQADFLSNYVYLLRVMQEFKVALKYFLYETADGQIQFDRPSFNAPITAIIDTAKYISYDLSETETGFYTEVFTLPGTTTGIYADEDIRQVFNRSSGYNLTELRRYGYRRPRPEHNPNINNPLGLSTYSKTVKELNNSELRTLTVTMPYDVTVDLTQSLWFQEKNLVGYVTEVNESIGYGKTATMTVTMTYLRRVTAVKGISDPLSIDFSKVNLGNVNTPGFLTIEDIPQFVFINDFFDGNFKKEYSTDPGVAPER